MELPAPEVMSQAFWILAFFAFLLGTAIGSFLNVCIYRMPLAGRSVMRPTFSFCFSCGTTLSWYDNLPLLSYLWLWGRCRRCGAVYSSRYFWIELLTGLMFLLLFLHLGPSLAFLTLIVFGCFLIVITFTDIDEYIIPDEISLGGIVVGLVFSMAAWWLDRLAVPLTEGLGVRHPGMALLGAILGGGGLYLIGWLGSLAFRRDAMGLGDVKLLAMMGTFIGPVNVVLTVPLASFIGVVVSVGQMVYNRILGRRNYAHIPFGPYLAIAGFLTLFIGQTLLGYLIPPEGLESLLDIWRDWLSVFS